MDPYPVPCRVGATGGIGIVIGLIGLGFALAQLNSQPRPG
jgi:hypothetical protein